MLSGTATLPTCYILPLVSVHHLARFASAFVHLHNSHFGPFQDELSCSSQPWGVLEALCINYVVGGMLAGRMIRSGLTLSHSVNSLSRMQVSKMLLLSNNSVSPLPLAVRSSAVQ